MASPCLLTKFLRKKNRMELNKKDAAVCPDSIEALASTTSAVEIDLYDELITFAGLSPEEQLRLGDPAAKPSAEERPADCAEEPSLPEAVLTPPPIESEITVLEADASTTQEAEATIEATEAPSTKEPGSPTSEETDAPSTGQSELDSSSEQLTTTYSIDAVESDTEAEQSPSIETLEEPPEPASIHAQIGTDNAQPSAESQTLPADETEENTSPEIGETPAIEPVQSAGIVSAAESTSNSDIPQTRLETGDLRDSLVAGPRPSGPLSGFNLPPEIVYTGALSRGVCLACGAESGTDDLFCLTCGVFIDEIASTLPSNPTCGECNQRIDLEEIFCPWCGSAVPT